MRAHVQASNARLFLCVSCVALFVASQAFFYYMLVNSLAWQRVLSVLASDALSLVVSSLLLLSPAIHLCQQSMARAESTAASCTTIVHINSIGESLDQPSDEEEEKDDGDDDDDDDDDNRHLQSSSSWLTALLFLSVAASLVCDLYAAFGDVSGSAHRFARSRVKPTFHGAKEAVQSIAFIVADLANVVVNFSSFILVIFVCHHLKRRVDQLARSPFRLAAFIRLRHVVHTSTSALLLFPVLLLLAVIAIATGVSAVFGDDAAHFSVFTTLNLLRLFAVLATFIVLSTMSAAHLSSQALRQTLCHRLARDITNNTLRDELDIIEKLPIAFTVLGVAFSHEIALSICAALFSLFLLIVGVRLPDI